MPVSTPSHGPKLWTSVTISMSSFALLLLLLQSSGLVAVGATTDTKTCTFVYYPTDANAFISSLIEIQTQATLSCSSGMTGILYLNPGTTYTFNNNGSVSFPSSVNNLEVILTTGAPSTPLSGGGTNPAILTGIFGDGQGNALLKFASQQTFRMSNITINQATGAFANMISTQDGGVVWSDCQVYNYKVATTAEYLLSVSGSGSTSPPTVTLVQTTIKNCTVQCTSSSMVTPCALVMAPSGLNLGYGYTTVKIESSLLEENVIGSVTSQGESVNSLVYFSAFYKTCGDSDEFLVFNSTCTRNVVAGVGSSLITIATSNVECATTPASIKNSLFVDNTVGGNSGSVVGGKLIALQEREVNK